jgi:hypothetical protein
MRLLPAEGFMGEGLDTILVEILHANLPMQRNQ